jgi:hypothetical protein
MENVSNEAIYLLKKDVEDKAGFAMRAPSNFSALSDDVYHTTGQTLSISTLKRIWGYVEASNNIRISTLTVLARYLGCRDWDEYCEKKHVFTSSTSDFIAESGKQASELNVGDELALEWSPDRFCHIRCLSTGRFEVLTSINGKLRKGDVFSAPFFALGQPFYASGILRGDEKLPPYVAGKRNGLTSVKFVHQGKSASKK